MKNVANLLNLWDFQSQVFEYVFSLRIKTDTQNSSLNLNFLNNRIISLATKIFIIDENKIHHQISNNSNIFSLNKSEMTLDIKIEIDLTKTNKDHVFECLSFERILNPSKIIDNQSTLNRSDTQEHLFVKMVEKCFDWNLAQNTQNDQKIHPIFKLILDREIGEKFNE